MSDLTWEESTRFTLHFLTLLEYSYTKYISIYQVYILLCMQHVHNTWMNCTGHAGVNGNNKPDQPVARAKQEGLI